MAKENSQIKPGSKYEYGEFATIKPVEFDRFATNFKQIPPS